MSKKEKNLKVLYKAYVFKIIVVTITIFATLLCFFTLDDFSHLLTKHVHSVHKAAIATDDLALYKKLLNNDDIISAVFVSKIDSSLDLNQFNIFQKQFVKLFSIQGVNYKVLIMAESKYTLLLSLCFVSLLTLFLVYFWSQLVVEKVIGAIKNEINLIGQPLQRMNSAHATTEVRPKSKLKEISVLQNEVGKVSREIEMQRSYWNDIAYTDKLTNIYNRAYLDTLLNSLESRTISEIVPVGAIFIDLDKFKYLNDTYGHAFGDCVLVEFTKLIKQNIRESDVPVRFGGDEFIIIIDNIKDDFCLRRFKENLTEQLSQFMIISDVDVKLSASVGYASFPQDVTNIRKLIDIADRNMYLEKGIKSQDNVMPISKQSA